jgi:lipopolysaccharide/colanic/teichoic acid biosynthesis glycosyltransferase
MTHRGPSVAPYPAIKRCCDVAGALLLLVLTSPVVAASLAAVWVDSGSPVIHRRRVMGRYGRPFDAYKIRTMVREADTLVATNPELRQVSAESLKLNVDPRVTRVGRWLRRSSVDELPQLVNVVMGQMSLVGPRMITPEEIPAWGATAGLLLAVRPGITGLWQVSGRQRLSRAERIRLDGLYVQRMSILLDIRIMARTIPAVLSGRGAM